MILLSQYFPQQTSLLALIQRWAVANIDLDKCSKFHLSKDVCESIHLYVFLSVKILLSNSRL